MEEFFQTVSNTYEYVIKFAIIIVDLICAGIICFTIIKSLINLFKHKEDIRLDVSEGILVALEFKLGGEVLRTLIVRELTELLILGIVIVLMAALSVFVQWGIKNEKKNAAVFKKDNVDLKDVYERIKTAGERAENAKTDDIDDIIKSDDENDSDTYSDEDVIKF